MSQDLRTVTFDLWDTLVVDDSDENQRASLGLRSKREERRHLVSEAVRRYRDISAEDIYRSYDRVEEAFRQAWHDDHVTWSVPERIRRVLHDLEVPLPHSDFEQIVEGHEQMEVAVPPELVEGVTETLAILAEKFKLAIVSDAIVSPGSSLRELLRGHDILGHFDAFSFSDEVGRSKPHASMFESVAAALGTPLKSMVHIGDRESNDVSGAQAVGMGAVLFVGASNVRRDGTSANAVCERFSDLPQILNNLNW